LYYYTLNVTHLRPRRSENARYTYEKYNRMNSKSTDYLHSRQHNAYDAVITATHIIFDQVTRRRYPRLQQYGGLVGSVRVYDKTLQSTTSCSPSYHVRDVRDVLGVQTPRKNKIQEICYTFHILFNRNKTILKPPDTFSWV